MARVSFSALIEEIVGKLAGSVFQNSYGGWQIRSRVTPRNPQTNFQQLRRGEFGYISSQWRTLTGAQRQTFIDAAGTPPEALNLFIQSNVNLSLINEPIINTYVPAAAPNPMTVEFINVTPEYIEIRATGGVTTVPAGTKLLIQVTGERPITRIFTNPTDYSPVITFNAGTDLSTNTDILSEWQSRYGVLAPNGRLCLKTAVIDKTNGNRSTEVINCANVEEMAKFIRINTNTTPVTTSGTTETDVFPFTLPASTFASVGDTIKSYIWGTISAVGGTWTLNFKINGSTAAGWSNATVADWSGKVTMTRINSTTLECVFEAAKNVGNPIIVKFTLGGLTFTNTIAIKWTLQNTVSGSSTAVIGFVNKELI